MGVCGRLSSDPNFWLIIFDHGSFAVIPFFSPRTSKFRNSLKKLHLLGEYRAFAVCTWTPLGTSPLPPFAHSKYATVVVAPENYKVAHKLSRFLLILLFNYLDYFVNSYCSAFRT